MLRVKLSSTRHSSLVTIKKISGARRVALEARADEAARECALELRADARKLAARGAHVFADEGCPVGGYLDAGHDIAGRQGFSARQSLDARRVKFPFGDEAVAVETFVRALLGGVP